MKLDTQKIQALSSLNPSAQAVLLHLHYKPRECRGGVLDIRRMLLDLRTQGIKYNRKEVIALFQALQDMKYGSIIKGKIGTVQKFIWTVRMKDVADIAVGEIVNRPEPKRRPEHLRVVIPTQGKAKPVNMPVGLTRIQMQGANGETVTISCPTVESATLLVRGLLQKGA